MTDSSGSWRDGGTTILRLRAAVDRFRTSLFGVPALWVLGSIALSRVMVETDQRTENADLPSVLDTTVDSARALLGAITSGTITAASVVFSLTLVAIQLSSSTYSSRVLRTFIRDRFQQNMIGLVLGTFFYSVLVLREVRGPLEDDGTAYIPRLSVALAIVLALAAMLGLLASINHTAQQLRVSAVSRDIVKELLGVIDARFDTAEGDAVVAVDGPGVAPAAMRRRSPPELPSTPGAVLESNRSGWIQQISIEALVDGVEPGSTVRLDVAAGTYVMAGAPLVTVWPAPSGVDAGHDEQLRAAFGIGEEQTMQQDVAFGIVTLEDIALRALSPGINDPNTARSIVTLLGEVVFAILSREPSAAHLDLDGRQLFRPQEPHHGDYVAAAFDQITHFARDQAQVMDTIIRTLVTVGDELHRRRRASEEAISALTRQLDRVNAELAAGDMIERDRRRLADMLLPVEWYDAPDS